MSSLPAALLDRLPLLPVTSKVRVPAPLRNLRGLPSLLASSGPLELRLATTERDVAKAQRLRFRVFVGEGRASLPLASAADRRDRCPFDRHADHLIVVDTSFLTKTGRLKEKVVGTYRLLLSDVAGAGPGFYSGTEFDLAPLLARHRGRQLLELGRSCVDARYRTRRVIDLLWRGIGIYAGHHGADALIGCASLPGTDPASLQVPVSFLRHYAAADAAWQAEPLPGRAASVELLDARDVTAAAVLPTLPPLIKAYLRAGGRFSPDPVIDHAFGCTDLFTVLPLANADRRYMAHFAGPLA